ncbi:hypothetical protein [Pseudonocardia hydrocarbonoxydans]|uniref:hypothetical protein n=1 Tax=Pseudonocardia hydrocarbonoxydans TaxID=76726 RepID=UPI0014775A23|nr:hypothetical protein [Pseudonocardia hydrocarbonoxydans]
MLQEWARIGNKVRIISSKPVRDQWESMNLIFQFFLLTSELQDWKLQDGTVDRIEQALDALAKAMRVELDVDPPT